MADFVSVRRLRTLVMQNLTGLIPNPLLVIIATKASLVMLVMSYVMLVKTFAFSNLCFISYKTRDFILILIFI